MAILDQFLDPESCIHRYLILALISTLGFGNYFCYDTPGALEKEIEEGMSVSASSFTSLYAVYSWPNVIMCFFGGILVDKVLGFRLGAIIFLVLLVTGQFLLAVGAFSNQFWLMLVGRFIYGLGGESLSVAQNTYTIAWFKEHNLNFAFGIQITISRAGSTLAFNTMGWLYGISKPNNSAQNALGIALMMAASTCVTSLVFSLILAFLDKRAERILNRTVVRSEEKISIRDVTNFKSDFWLLTLICVTFYLTIFPFISIGVKFFEQKWGYEPGEAKLINSIVYFISAVLSPIIGYMVDRLGRNLIFLLVASLLVMFSHVTMTFTYIWLWVPMVVMGLGYSIMCSALWPLVSRTVGQNQIATAYGVMQAIQNLGLAVAANISGILLDWKGYITVELFFIFWVATSVISSVILLIQDNERGSPLNKSQLKRRTSEAHLE